jgi:hypothetical protein
MKTKHKYFLYQEKTLTGLEYGTHSQVCSIGLENLESLKDDKSSPGEKQM